MTSDRNDQLHQALASYMPEDGGATRNYSDLHDHVLALARQDLLVVIDELKQRMTKPLSGPEPSANLLLGPCTLRIR